MGCAARKVAFDRSLCGAFRMCQWKESEWWERQKWLRYEPPASTGSGRWPAESFDYRGL